MSTKPADRGWVKNMRLKKELQAAYKAEQKARAKLDDLELELKGAQRYGKTHYARVTEARRDEAKRVHAACERALKKVTETIVREAWAREPDKVERQIEELFDGQP